MCTGDASFYCSLGSQRRIASLLALIPQRCGTRICILPQSVDIFDRKPSSFGCLLRSQIMLACEAITVARLITRLHVDKRRHEQITARTLFAQSPVDSIRLVKPPRMFVLARCLRWSSSCGISLRCCSFCFLRLLGQRCPLLRRRVALFVAVLQSLEHRILVCLRRHACSWTSRCCFTVFQLR